MNELNVTDIKIFARDIVNDKNTRLFEIKANDEKSIIRTVNVFSMSLSIRDFIFNDKFINYDGDEIPSIEKYEINIPLELYKSCALKDNKFILNYKVLSKMKELSPELFDKIKPVKWFIKSYPIDEVNRRLEVLNGTE